MSDALQIQKEREKQQQQQMAERLSYENKLADITKDKQQDFDYNSENLLYTETTQSMVMESDIEALANYSEIKAKQRSAGPIDPEDFHTEQYQTGKRAVEFMNAKKSHRSMGKRKNKMKESVKRLNKVGENARKLKENADGMSPEERIESLAKLYDNVRVADRYFAEGIAANKNEENKLKEKAEITYVQNLCNLYAKEIEKTLNIDKKAELRGKMNELSEKLSKMKQTFAGKYSKNDFTQHKLGAGENLVDNLEEKAQNEQQLKTEAEESLKKYENGFNNNTMDKGNNPDWTDKAGKSVQDYLYSKSKYSDGDAHGNDYIIKEMEKDANHLVFMTQKELSKHRTYSVERRNLWGKYKEITPEEKEKIIRATPAYKEFSASVREAMEAKLLRKLNIEDRSTRIKTKHEEKHNLVNNALVSERNKLTMFRNIESYERKLNILKEHLREYSGNKYKDLDLTKEKNEIEERISKNEQLLAKEKNDLKETYIKETNIEDANNVTDDEAITYYRSNILLKDNVTGKEKSLKDFDLDEEIAKQKEILEKTSIMVAPGTTLDPATVKLSVWMDNARETIHNYYFPAGSEMVEKLKHNLKIGHTTGGGSEQADINRNIERSLRPVKFDDRGKVLKEYEKNDEFNRKFIDSHVNITLTEDTSNDDKVFEERLPSLMSIMDEILSFDLNDEVLSIDNLSKSQDNAVKFQHMSGVTLTFHSNILKDRINLKLKEYCKKDPELKKKWERVELYTDLFYRRIGIVSPGLARINLDNQLKVAPKPKEEDIKKMEEGAKDEYETFLKKYNDKFGGE